MTFAPATLDRYWITLVGIGYRQRLPISRRSVLFFNLNILLPLKNTKASETGPIIT